MMAANKAPVHQVVIVLILTSVLHYTKSSTEYFSIISDIHYDPTYWTVREGCYDNALTGPLPIYGTFDCEPSWQLVVNAVENLVTKGPNAKFIIWLGDNAHHFSHTLTEPPILTSDVMFEILQNVTDLLKEKVGNTPVLPVLGNHDWIPKNELPDSYNDGYDRLADMWSSWFDAVEEPHTFRKGGYYSLLVDDRMGLRAVVLNGNLYLTRNNAVRKDDEDPAGQYAWLQNTLQRARTNSERVLLINHVPLGMSESNFYPFMNTTHSSKLAQYVRDFSDVIIAIIAGHAHTDIFMLIYNGGVPVAYQLVTPAVTPWKSPYPIPIRTRNPGLRSVHYDNTNGQLQDYDQYYLDITQVAKDETVDPSWVKEYSLRAAYDLGDLSAASLHDLLQNKIKPEGSTEFSDYYRYVTVSVPDDQLPTCNCSCKIFYLCSAEFVDVEAYTQCLETPICGVTTSALSLTLATLITLFYVLLA